MGSISTPAPNVQFLELSPSESGRQSAQFYRPEIDGLRALAVLAVIANHTNSRLLPSGYLGVDIFFVISGYVITASLASRSGWSLPAFLGEFYTRRIKRLVPALILCVGFTGLLTCLFSADPQISLRTGIWSLAGLSNIYLFAQASNYFAATSSLNVFAQTWSLGVEEQFYFAYPTLIWCIARVGGKSHRSGLSLAIIGLLSAASLALYLKLAAVNQSAAYFLPLTRLWELGIGCCLFVPLRPRPRAAAGRLTSTIALMALCAVLFAPLSWNSAATVAAVGCSALLIMVLKPETGAYRILTRPSALYIGTISYSLYLWHWSVLSLSHWTVGVEPWSIPLQLLLMVGLAAASYRFVERPLRHANWSWAGGGGITWGLLALVACGGFLVMLEGPLGERLYLGAATPSGQQLHSTEVGQENSVCADPPEITPTVVAECSTYPPGLKAQTFYFMGDSHTIQLKPLAARLAMENGVATQVLSVPGTPSPPLIYSIEKRRSPLVDAHRNKLQTKILRLATEATTRGDLFVLSNRLSYYFVDTQISAIEENYRFAYFDSPSREISISRESALERWIADLEDVADALSSRGSSVVVFLPLPEFRGSLDPYPVEACAPQWFRPNPSTSHCIYGETINRAALTARVADLTQRLRSAADRHENLFVFDPFPGVCPEGPSCGFYLDGERVFEDDDHLSAQGARMLYPHFQRFLKENELLIGEPLGRPIVDGAQ